MLILNTIEIRFAAIKRYGAGETKMKTINAESNPTFLPYTSSSLSGIVNKDAARILPAKNNANRKAKK